MSNFENTFIRGPSPTYSEEITSENGLCTQPIDGDRGDSENFITLKMFNNVYDPNVYNQKSIPLRGRNTFAFWTVVILLFVLTIGNLLLTITIIGVLRLGKGMQGMELIPEEDSIKFFGETDLDRIYNKYNGQIDGFEDEPMTITGDDSSVTIKVNRNGQLHTKMVMDKVGTTFKGVNAFEVKDPHGDTIFTTHRPHYILPQGANKLQAKVTSSSHITSPIGRPLGISSEDNKISIKGSEGIMAEAQGIFLISDDIIFMNSTQGAVRLSGGDGIFLDMQKMPIVNSEYGIRTGNIQYKICVCMPQGKLFRIPVPRMYTGKITCAHFSTDPIHDPCA